MPADDKNQDHITRASALALALEDALTALAKHYGNDAREKITVLRDETILKFKRSSIPPDREMEHARIVQPAIDVLHAVFDSVLGRLPGTNDR